MPRGKKPFLNDYFVRFYPLYINTCNLHGTPGEIFVAYIGVSNLIFVVLISDYGLKIFCQTLRFRYIF